MWIYLKNTIKKNEKLYELFKKIYSVLISQIKIIRQKEKNFSHEYDIREILMQQNTPEGYNRLDIFVRLLAVEEEHGLNDYGWNLYRKMQDARVPNEDKSTEERVVIFKKLIASWKENGYDCNYEIWLDKNLNLDDGSHRLALALYYGVETINCKVLMINHEINYGEDWFRRNGFNENEISIIKAKALSYLANLKIRITCILWPPVLRFFDEITEMISEKYKVESSMDLMFSDDTFRRYIKGVYRIDDIDDWKIERKLEYMSEYPEKKIRLLIIEFAYPRFRYKELNKNTILIQGEELKAKIRDIYKNKMDHYFYDIICHTGDNVLQSEYIEKLSHPCFSLRELFDKIKKKKWEIIKFESKNIPADFPDSFPFSKDVDIICDESDLLDIVEMSREYLANKCKKYYDEIKVVQEGYYRYRIRIEIEGFLVFQIDLASQVEGIDDTFIKDSLNRRRYIDCYYVPSPEDEICFRVNEGINYPTKSHHIEYLKENRENIDRDLVVDCVCGGEAFLKKIGLYDTKIK